ncbi:hypothetical protein APHAL10511_001792 [Amanita phalloides]|nr:hypothetical protein APHAL10511_001792 [Amanita phalloides]
MASSSSTLIPVVDTEEIRRRREQSDRASREIGNRLLQGWTMLADECPNPTCYGVPLVRPPGGRDSRRAYLSAECVICGADVDSSGRTQTKGNNQSAGVEASSTIIPTASDPAKTGSEIATQDSLPQLTDTDKTFHVLKESSKSLQATLHSLSTRLASLSAGSTMDPTSICSTADAMLKVTQALSQVKELERSELQYAYRNLNPSRSTR